MACGNVVFDTPTELYSVDVGHHVVAYDQIGIVVSKQVERLTPLSVEITK